MIGLLQRVAAADVSVDGRRIAAIGVGLLVFVGVERDDRERDAERLAERLLGYRVFEDDEGRMNRSVMAVGGSLLVVPQFTLAADTRKGARPSFSSAATPETGRALFRALVDILGARGARVSQGCFGASMQVSLTNDGPVTFLLRTGARSP